MAHGTRQTVLLLSALLWIMGSGGASAQEDPSCGEAQLDNDLSEMDLEIYCVTSDLDPGQIRIRDQDEDGDFDLLVLGVKGGGTLFGFWEFDGQPEAELVVSDPTLEVGRVRNVDADSDGDPEVLWIGTQGRDLNGDGRLEPQENGEIVGFADVDGDGLLEIIVMDKARSLGEFLADSFGSYRVIWVGVLNAEATAAIGAFRGLNDIDSDGDDEILLEDLSRRPGEVFIDLDDDGDPDLIIS